MSARASHPDTEETGAGRQMLISSVTPVSLRERLQRRADAPLEAKHAQKPCDCGLFDLEGRSQIDLIELLRAETRDRARDSP